ncbi:unnamed protein product [Lampetra planeri]
MVIVVEVISYLEKYPITKEALEETRLGKLINDVRKKTKNEDLAKRAKKLLRNWQKLIEPGTDEVLSKGHTGASWSSNGGANIATTPPSGKPTPELKNRNDFNNCFSPKVEKQSNKKCKGDQNEAHLFPAKISKTTFHNKNHKHIQLSANGNGNSSEMFLDSQVCQPLARNVSEPLDTDKLNKIPVKSVKPHPSAQGCSKPPSTSMLLKASVLQQGRQAASGGQYRPRSPRCSLNVPQTPKPDAVVKQVAPQAQSIATSAVRPGPVENSGLGPSSPSFNVCVKNSWSVDLDSQSRPPSMSRQNSEPFGYSAGLCLGDDGAFMMTCKRKREKNKSKDYVVSLDRQTVEDSLKTVRLKDRRLTFDPVTGQIKPNKEFSEEKEVRLGHRSEPQRTDQSKQNPPVPSSPFQQTNWKELSRSEIIQAYLSQQSNVLTSSGVHTPGAHFFMTECLKNDENGNKVDKETHVLASELPARDLPGLSRDVNSQDVNRLHTEHWSGVNGCYDSQGNWYDWTECISLDAHGDESRLNILPYVCLD